MALNYLTKYVPCGSVLLSIMKILQFTKYMDRTLKQIYVDDSKISTTRKNEFTYRKKHAINKCNTYERPFMCYETDTESHEISTTSFSITCCNEQHWDCYRTAERYSYVNTAAVTSNHNTHCTLIALHMTVGSAAITGVAFCGEWSLVLWQLILCTGYGHRAAHWTHVVHES